MKHSRPSFYIVVVFLTLLAACAPDLVESPGQPVATLEPTPTDAILGSGLQPITMTAPPMEIGSTYRYVDGSILDAVPDKGPFMMGDGLPDNPAHPVTVSNFWIYSTEVSNQMYAWCVGAGKCTPPDPMDNPAFSDATKANDPVVGVTWQQAADYCSFVHGQLPTEAEWEKAAGWDEAKQTRWMYPWGNASPACNEANFRGCTGSVAAAGSYPQGKSPYGVLNMAGNVFEWVSDWYSADYYRSSPAQDPQGPAAGVRRVIRSSSFYSDASMAETTRRSSAIPTEHRNDLGFRCIVQDPTYFAPFCRVPSSYAVIVPAAGAKLNRKPCPDPIIVHGDYCAEKKPMVNVTVLNTDPTVVTITGLEACNPSNNDPGVAHQCNSGVTIHVNAQCYVLPAGKSSCPAGYQPDLKDPSQCMLQVGGSGACPDGYQFDSSNRCCSAAPDNVASVPLCNVGQHLFGNTCVDDGMGPQPPLSQTYTTSTGLTCAP